MTKSCLLMWVKLWAIVAVTIILLYRMFIPVSTVDVTLDVPNGMSAESMPAVVTGLTWLANVASAVMGALVIGVAVWLGRTVIRHHRR